MTLKPGAAFECAKEFTITAIEQSMIPASKDPKETAENVADFFNCLLESFVTSESNN